MGNNDIYINDVKITADILEEQWMESVATINDNMYTFEFGSDNRAGIDGLLHRISANEAEIVTLSA